MPKQKKTLPHIKDQTEVLKEDQTTLKAELKKAKEQEACLILIRGSPQGQRIFLNQLEMVIGRDPAVEVSVNDQGVSRRHAVIKKKSEGGIELSDLNSSNGTFVNDKKLHVGQSILLEKEDMIKVGSTIFKYLPAGELEILFYGNLGSAAHTDPLTQVYNKGYLLEALEAEFKRAKALHTEFSLIFFDLDHFKKINDTYGHAAGDYVLKEFTQLIRTQYVKPNDVFARYGGEEFVLLLAQTSGQAAVELAEHIRASVELHRFIFEGKRLAVTSSLGVAELHSGVESAQTLLKNADRALYSAKGQGRNRVVL